MNSYRIYSRTSGLCLGTYSGHVAGASGLVLTAEERAYGYSGGEDFVSGT